jgi:hypothetical protein
MRPSDGVTGTRRSEDLAESIFSERPFSRMGVQSPQCPQFRGWLADRYARDLVQTVGLSSHRWKIDPDRGVRPVDFAD